MGHKIIYHVPLRSWFTVQDLLKVLRGSNVAICLIQLNVIAFSQTLLNTGQTITINVTWNIYRAYDIWVSRIVKCLKIARPKDVSYMLGLKLRLRQVDHDR